MLRGQRKKGRGKVVFHIVCLGRTSLVGQCFSQDLREGLQRSGKEKWSSQTGQEIQSPDVSCLGVFEEQHEAGWWEQREGEGDGWRQGQRNR